MIKAADAQKKETRQVSGLHDSESDRGWVCWGSRRAWGRNRRNIGGGDAGEKGGNRCIEYFFPAIPRGRA